MLVCRHTHTVAQVGADLCGHCWLCEDGGGSCSNVCRVRVLDEAKTHWVQTKTDAAGYVDPMVSVFVCWWEKGVGWHRAVVRAEWRREGVLPVPKGREATGEGGKKVDLMASVPTLMASGYSAAAIRS